MKKRILVLLAVLALMVTCMVFAVSADAAFEENFVCPCGCGKKYSEISWQNFLTNGYSWTKGDHYLINDMTPNGAATLTGVDDGSGEGTKEIVLLFYKNGDSSVAVQNKKASNRTFTIPAKTTAWLVGAPGTVVGNNATSLTTTGGVIRVEEGATLNVSGSFTFQRNASSTGTPTQGGIIYNNGTLNMDGEITVKGTTVSTSGGAIFNSGTMSLSGNVVIEGGSAPVGGNVYNDASCALTMTGGTIKDGIATDVAEMQSGMVVNDYEGSGGNIYINRYAPVTFNGTIIKNGEAATGTGGNIASRGRLTIKGDTQVLDGEAILGGNIYSYDNNKMPTSSASAQYIYGTLDIQGGTISGGVATGATRDNETIIAKGGNIYVNGAGLQMPKDATPIALSSYQLKEGFKMSGGAVTGGTAAEGAAIYFANTIFKLSGGTITGGTATDKGGSIAFYDNAELKISGSSIIQNGTATNGGNIYAGDALTMSGGTIQNGSATTNGGNIYSNEALTISNGTITGGVAGEYTVDGEGNVTATTTIGLGGNIYSAASTVTMTNGTVSNGKAYNGGCIYFGGANNSVISGGTVEGGEALRGGNLYGFRRFDVEGTAVVQNGSALHAYRKAEETTTAMGGNVHANSNNFYLEGTAQVLNGYSDYNGGNISGAGDTDDTIYVRILGGSVKDGVAANDGGNVYVNSTNGVIKMNGGTVEGGTAVQHGGYRSNNIHIQRGEMDFAGGEVKNTVTSAKAGDAIYANAATLTLDGNAIANYKDSFNVYVTNSADLIVNSGFTGEVWLYTWDRIGHETTGAEVYGTKLTSLTKADNTTLVATGTTTATGVYTGKLLLAGTTEHNYASDTRPENKFVAKYAAGVGVVAVNTAEEGATATYELYIAEAAVEYKNGEETVLDWYATVEEAVAAASGKADRYVELYKAENEFAVAADQVVYINFNDKNATVTNNGTVYGFDSYCGPTTEADSEVTVTGNAFVTQVNAPAPDSHKYIALVDAGVTTFHELTLEIVSVNLRPSAETASLYYTADIKGDATLMAKVQKAGVAVTLKGDAAPNALDDYMYTTVPADNGDYNGALVAGIINNNGSEDNGARATTEIYARAYIDLNGEIIMSERVDWSLLEVVNEVAGMYGELGDLQSYFDSLYDWCSKIALPDDKAWADKAEAAV